MTDLEDGLAQVRARALDADRLVGAVAAGRRRGEHPTWRRAELRYVDLKAGRRLQVTTYDATQAHTANHAPGADAVAAVDAPPVVAFAPGLPVVASVKATEVAVYPA